MARWPFSLSASADCLRNAIALRPDADTEEREGSLRSAWLAALVACAASSARAEDNSADLATKLANPVASLISVPFQFNYDCCAGPANGNRVTLNIQPVVPLALNADWNLIVRTIVPVIAQQATFDGLGDAVGLGNTTQSFFFSPNPSPGGITWALGPAFLWPTVTDETFGARKWGAGPTGLILKQAAGWTYGVLANHIWSYAGENSRPNISSTFVQPFVGYTWPDSTGLTLTSESTYDWSHDQWTVPLNLVLSHIFKFGAQPVSFQFGARYYPVRGDSAASWGARLAIIFLFPK